MKQRIKALLPAAFLRPRRSAFGRPDRLRTAPPPLSAVTTGWQSPFEAHWPNKVSRHAAKAASVNKLWACRAKSLLCGVSLG